MNQRNDGQQVFTARLKRLKCKRAFTRQILSLLHDDASHAKVDKCYMFRIIAQLLLMWKFQTICK